MKNLKSYSPPLRKAVLKSSYNYTKSLGEINSLPSETKPNDTFSVRDIMKRFVNGMMPTGRVGVFDGEEIFIPDLDSLDMVELQQIRDESLDQIKQAEAAHKKASKAQAELLDKQRFEEAVGKAADDRIKSFKKDGRMSIISDEES